MRAWNWCRWVLLPLTAALAIALSLPLLAVLWLLPPRRRSGRRSDTTAREILEWIDGNPVVVCRELHLGGGWVLRDFLVYVDGASPYLARELESPRGQRWLGGELASNLGRVIAAEAN